MTKDGSLAGPKTLEHLVDAVLDARGRALRGAAARPGLEEPLRLDRGGRRVRDGRGGAARGRRPGARVPRRPRRTAPGSVVAPTLEGSRPILVEVQALVAPGRLGTPRRTASGIDPNRLALLIAVLGRRAGIGARRATTSTSTSPAADASRSPASTCRSRSPSRRRSATGPIAPGTVAIGEVGLLGELRPVPGLERRLREAARLGFERAIVPARRRGAAAARSSTGSTIVASRRCATRSRRRSIGPPARVARRVRRDARLAAAPDPPDGWPRRDRRYTERPVIRNIRLLGVALGGLVGIALAAAGGACSQPTP